MNTKKIVSITTGLTLVAGLALAAPTFAQSNNTQPRLPRPAAHERGGINGKGMRPAVVGKVSAINGNSIMVSGRQGFGSSTTQVTYTVDATNAVVNKNNATSTVSSISVGDMILVQGTVNGTNVVATNIRDGVQGKGIRGENGKQKIASSTQPTLGNGQPVIAGKVSVINGNNLTVTTSGNTAYTVDATNAKVLEGQNAASLSNVAVGDTVLVQGTVNNTSITASTIIDQSQSSANSTTNNENTPNKPQSRGFFGGIGQFFIHLFGF